MLVSSGSCLSLTDSAEVIMEGTSSISMTGLMTALIMSGGARIVANDTSVKFTPSASVPGVEFTYAELAALKDLITNS